MLALRLRRGALGLAAALLCLAVSSAVPQTPAGETLDDDTLFLRCEVPPEWARMELRDQGDINPSILRYAFSRQLRSSRAALVITHEDVVYAFSASEMLSAMEEAFTGAPDVMVEQTSVQGTVGGRAAATMRLAGNGDGYGKLTGGTTPTKRLIVVVPNGPDTIQFIFTCPAGAFAPFEPLFADFLRQVTFTGAREGKERPRPDGEEPRVPVPPQNSGPKVSPEVPYVSADYWQLSARASARVAGLLYKEGLEIYESLGANAPYDLVVVDPEDGAPHGVQAALPIVEGAQPADLEWEMKPDRVARASAVVLLKSRSEIGWVVPTSVIERYCEHLADGTLLLRAKTPAGDRTVLEELAPFTDLRQALSSTPSSDHG